MKKILICFMLLGLMNIIGCSSQTICREVTYNLPISSLQTSTIQSAKGLGVFMIGSGFVYYQSKTIAVYYIYIKYDNKGYKLKAIPSNNVFIRENNQEEPNIKINIKFRNVLLEIYRHLPSIEDTIKVDLVEQNWYCCGKNLEENYIIEYEIVVPIGTIIQKFDTEVK